MVFSTCSICIFKLIISFVNNYLSSNLMKIQLYYSYLPASQLFNECMDILISAEPSTSIQNHDVCVDCTILQEEVAYSNQQIHNLQKEINASKAEIKYLQITTQNTQQQLDNVRYYVQLLWNKQQVNYTLACIWCQDTQSSTCSVCIFTLIISFVNNCLSSNLMKIQLFYSYLPASQLFKESMYILMSPESSTST
jgi:hypothetical protein